ncbi:FtsK/SpoIIIE domain-containing protein [Cellulosimicrobium funkei]|uniref:FtsK/SpoIIIE domain-containing protein n=1 Tax=Cellulosimicrobium funkei TaxID=264251 RepID=UPI00341C67AF
MNTLSTTRAVARTLAVAVWHVIAWTARSWRLLAVCVVLGNVLVILRRPVAGYLVMSFVPAFSLVRAVWCAVHPVSYEVVLGGPLRRSAWRRRVRRDWTKIALRCGLVWPWGSKRRQDVPRLKHVRTRGNTLVLSVRATVGQTVDTVMEARDAIAAAVGAQSAESRPVGPGLVELVLTMRELLHEVRTPSLPDALEVRAVTLGRRADGLPWRLELGERHTLVVGRSGAGKGSILWGIAGNLAPATHAGLVRLWGIDLKGGVEVAVGAPMLSDVAMDEQAAVRLLRSLNEVIVARQAVMRGHSRTFEATPGDPAHVLLIDELAVLTGYATREVVNEAGALLKRILTQGRALGVMVVAFVQDPRKETVGMRELFTQTIALRLASSSETRMVLGDGYADLAPAHRIDRTMPGAGYAVGNDGAVERVRADFWSDDFIRLVASRFPAPSEPPPVENDVPGKLLSLVPPDDAVAPRRRSPRTPRGGDDPDAA